MSWPEGAVELFHELHARRPRPRYGDIAATINAAYGTRITKNACIGFAWRIARDLEPKSKPIGGMMLWTAEQNDCRWPEGQDPPFLFCGAPKLDGCPYCIDHARRAYNGAGSRR